MTGTDCRTQGDFAWGVYGNWLEQVWNGDKRCNTVTWATEFTVYDPNDYMRCICSHFDSSNASCMVATDTTDTTDTSDTTDTTDDTT